MRATVLPFCHCEPLWAWQSSLWRRGCCPCFGWIAASLALLAMTRCGLRRGDKGGEDRAFGGREKEFSERKEGFGGQKSFSGGRKILSGALASHLDEEERCFNGLKRLSRGMFPFCHCESYRAWQSSPGRCGRCPCFGWIAASGCRPPRNDKVGRQRCV